ncbi:MAG: diguanylate cyclase [Azovibrio sp.]|uniref:GGDEF domain-containing response regulator n=1 Tax=Azovibrio sp. TaxID=1872673 RepID=UPI003C746CE5
MSSPSVFCSEKLARLAGGFDSHAPIRVLVVEDSKTVRYQLRGYLQLLENVTVVEAETLAETRELLTHTPEPFFCAILDLTLPDASGSEVVDLVQTFKVPSIVLTATLDPMIRQAVLDRRVIDYMFKTGAAAIEDVAYLVGRLRQNREMTVLVVDDSATFRIHLSRLLEQYRFRILTASNGLEALALLQEHQETALVLTDYYMPKMDGLTLIRQIRRVFRREDLAIITLSDATHPDLSAAMIKAGANDYLNKHFQVEEFYCRIVQNINMVRFVRQLRDLANRDYLTHLYNRRRLFEIAELRLSSARKQHGPIALALLDADHFKRINDHYGHATGDLALKKIADVLRRGSDSHDDLVARYGGEEFVCFSTLTADETPACYFEALRRRIEAIDLEVNGERIPLTVSIGYTTDSRGTLSEIINRADQAMYQAKAAGRNRVVHFETQAS